LFRVAYSHPDRRHAELGVQRSALMQAQCVAQLVRICNVVAIDRANEYSRPVDHAAESYQRGGDKRARGENEQSRRDHRGHDSLCR
jgi:hypothetical protein